MSVMKRPTGGNRNGNIELLRFLFAVGVVLHHASLPIMKGGWFGVEFFFIVTGYFLAHSTVGKYEKESIRETFDGSAAYILRRIGSLYPYFLLSCIPAILVDVSFRLIQGQSVMEAVWKRLVLLPYDLLFLQNYGFASPSFIGTLWYLSALFFALWVLVPIMRRFGYLYSTYFAWMVNVVLCGALMRLFGALSGTAEYSGSWLNAGFLRAIAMISLGTAAYHFSEKLKNSSLGEKKSLLSLLEVICYVGVFAYMFVWKPSYAVYEYTAVIVLVIGIIITTSGKSIFYGRFDSAFVRRLGRFSMVLFMNHCYWLFTIVDTARCLNIDLSDTALKVIGIVLSFITAIVVEVIGDHIIKKRSGSGEHSVKNRRGAGHES